MRRQELERIDLPSNVDLNALCAACNVAIRAYLDGTGATKARLWGRIRGLAANKIVGGLQAALRALPPNDPETLRAQQLADELEQLQARASRRIQEHGPISEKGQLHVQIMRGWTNAGGSLGASYSGPLQRLLCFVAQHINEKLDQRERGGASIPQTRFVKLKPSGARDAISREQKRREILTVARTGEDWCGKGKLGADAYLLDQFGNRKE
jgi:hypothetical protein